ncbi:TetR/AcrR family transcriptional regulator [Lysinibacillus yapensis]|uniref:TetR/AcrR family transcriptional regulator n=2 Tax=Ureibacillus yapensis TaxID=2304605 RepID=A0A396SC14_9BACL|nr:TetR/AcrR family transcriptional regulator [Lysinibacillus yapensis]
MSQSRRVFVMQTDERRQERKRQLIEITLELFATKGYENTKISEIVSKAGVSQGTFYWYFESKESICLEVLEEGKLKILEAISQGFRTTKVDVKDSERSTISIFTHIFQFAEKNPFLMQIILKGIHSQRALQEKVDAIKTDMEKSFANNIKQAQDLNMIEENIDPAMQSIFIMSLLEGVLSRWLFSSNETLQQKTLKQIISETVHFEFFGIFGV